jgi:hypothetical protein
MANGPKGFRGAISDKELEIAKRQVAKGGPRNGRLKKLLGMTKRPTAAGQAKFGDVDVSGGGLKEGRFKGAVSDRELEAAKRAAGY